MEIVKLQSGLIAHRLSESEQKVIWKELEQDISVIGKNIALETPQDNLKYYIISEIQTSFEKYEATIKANEKIFKVKYNICNQDVKIYKAVRKAYGKQ